MLPYTGDYIEHIDDNIDDFKYYTQTSHIKNGGCTLKNQHFSAQNSNQAAFCPYSRASRMYFGSL